MCLVVQLLLCPLEQVPEQLLESVLEETRALGVVSVWEVA
ncbi:hypothetical protein PF007_g30124 [Phytophthora fragariae]|uniref:Uncharacterized protein n=1 Tax=Phytophthora fragariae TaxID=53985 RepID=A0A6A3PRR5_9STRA|nr:hypothetical protein PF007_g30124 [Phytophthora fragariae]